MSSFCPASEQGGYTWKERFSSISTLPFLEPNSGCNQERLPGGEEMPPERDAVRAGTWWRKGVAMWQQERSSRREEGPGALRPLSRTEEMVRNEDRGVG